MSRTRRELLAMRWLAPEGPTPGQALAQRPVAAPLPVGCSAERAPDEAPPPWVRVPPRAETGGDRG